MSGLRWRLRQENPMKAARELSRPAALAAGLAIASPAQAANGWLSSPCAFPTTDGALLLALLAGAAAASAIAALVFRHRARSLAKQSLRHATRLDMLATIEANHRALAAIEPQACVIWSDGHPRIALYTLQSPLGVPAKLAQLLRFGSWLHPDDAGRAAASLGRLQTHGEAFISNASTLEGHVIELAGAVCGAETVLRIRPFSPVNKELVRLISENKHLRQSVHDRESVLDSLPVPVWLRDAKGTLSWVNTAYVAAIGAASKEEALNKQIELFETRQRAELLRLGQSKKPGR